MRALLIYIHLLSWSLIVSAQQVVYFTGAIWINGNSGSYAVQAQCPATNPVSCSSIQEPGYCCPANNYCTWANSQVACCPWGSTCSGWGGAGWGGGGSSPGPYHPTSWYATTTQWHPTSTQWHPTSTQWQAQPSTYVAPAGYTSQQSTVSTGGYCSTLYANGPGLPTTAQGDCGIILIMNPNKKQKPPNAGARSAIGYLELGVMVVALQVLGGMIFALR